MPKTPNGAVDSMLPAFLSAANDAEAGEILRQLLEVEAAPAIDRVLGRKLSRGGSGAESFDAADLKSATREELIRHLFKLRRGEAATPILNFQAYVSGVAYNVWVHELRAQHPARSMLLNRLQYLLGNRTTQHGFALWTGVTGERWCGFARFQQGMPPGPTPKLEWLVVDTTAAAREVFAGQDWRGLNLAELLAELFGWLERPIELNSLIDVVAQLLEISDEQESLGDEMEEHITSSELSPVDSLKWQEYLQWLWSELSHLSLPQRTAFILHSGVTIEFDFRGVASIRQIASLLGMPPEELAEIWNSIPQDDLKIAERLGLARQQVINLRRVARDRLGATWQKWIN